MNNESIAQICKTTYKLKSQSDLTKPEQLVATKTNSKNEFVLPISFVFFWMSCVKFEFHMCIYGWKRPDIDGL